MNNKKDRSITAWISGSFGLTLEGAALYRIFYGLFLLFFLMPSLKIYPFINSLPSVFFQPPPGPMMLFSNFPSGHQFLILHGMLFITTVSLIAGYRTRLSSLLAGILLLLLKGFIYSIGKINHDFLIVVIPFLMAFSGWGRRYSIDATGKSKAERHCTRAAQWPLMLLAFFIGFMFFTAGFSKIIGGWLAVDSQAALGHFYKQYFVVERRDFLANAVISVSNRAIWECMDYLTVLFEISFVLAIFRVQSIKVYICFAVLFHFSLMMILNISFLPNFVAYAAFINWEKIADFVRQRATGTRRKWSPPVIFTLFVSAAFTGILLLDSGTLLEGDWGLPGFVIVTAGALVALHYLIKQLTFITAAFKN